MGRERRKQTHTNIADGRRDGRRKKNKDDSLARSIEQPIDRILVRNSP